MWNRAVRRGRAASWIVRSTKSSSPAGLAYTAGLPKIAPLLYCTPPGLSIAPPSPGEMSGPGRGARDGALLVRRPSMTSGAASLPPRRASTGRTGAAGDAISRAGGRAGGWRGDGLGAETGGRGLTHDIAGGRPAGEQDELRGRRRDEQFEAVDHPVSARARSTGP